MKLWLLLPKENLPPTDNPWQPWYDKVFGFVVRAENEEQARSIANENGGDEKGPIRYVVYRSGGDPWLKEEYSTCTELSEEGESGIVLRDLRSA